MKVLQVVTTLAHGGAQATVLASCRDLPPDVEVVVVAGADDTGEGSLRDDFEAAGVRLIVVGSLRRWMGAAVEARAVVDLARILRAERPDVVHTHSSKAGVLGRLAAAAVGVPVVHTVHGWSFNGRGRAAAGAIVGVERLLAPVAAALVVVSAADVERGLRAGIGTPDRYRLIRAGIDLAEPRRARAERSAVRCELGLEPDAFVVGTVARMSRQKDLPCLIEAFALVSTPRAELVVVGDGPERASIEDAVDRLGLDQRVRLLGHRSDGARLVAAFDCFVLTSLWEGLPRSLVEAVAAGVPTVATMVGGNAELLGGGRGLLVRPGDHGGVAAAIDEVAADPLSARSRARLAEAAVEPFDEAYMRADLVRLWRGVAGPGGAGVRDESRPEGSVAVS
jgi:glycosyltransferase involved in cell wall biosynthesis